MKKIYLYSLLFIISLPLYGDADLGRLVSLGFSIPEERTAAPVLDAWLEGKKETLVPREKPLLLYFWTSHIPGSMADLPQLNRLVSRLDGEKLLIAAVNLNDEPALVKEYAEQARLSLPLYLFPESPTLNPYIMNSVPSLWLIDRQGRGAALCEGNVPWDHPDLIRTLKEFSRE